MFSLGQYTSRFHIGTKLESFLKLSNVACSFAAHKQRIAKK